MATVAAGCRASPASSNDETSTSSTNSTRCTSNWAIRSPRCTTMGAAGSKLIRATLISPR